MRLLVLTIISLGLVLRFWGIGEKNVWLDETASWVVATADWPEFWRLAELDVHPPLYYLLLKGWIARFGDGETAMRSLSAITSGAVLWFAWILARRFLPRAVALAVLAWLAISPHQIFHAQEARMYPLVALAVLAGTVAFVRWIDSDGRSGRALTALAAAMAIAMYSHYFTALWIAGLVCYAAWWRPAQGRAAALGRFAVAIAAAAVLYLPWASVALMHVTRGQPWRAPVGPEDLPFQIWSFASQLVNGYYTEAARLRHGGALLFLVTVVGLVALTMSSRKATHRAADAKLLLTLTFVPILIGIAALFRAGDMHLVRYLGYLLPVIAIAAARGLCDLLGSTRRTALILAASTAALLPATSAVIRNPSRDSDIRPLIRAIEDAGGAPDSPVLIAPDFMSPLLHYYRPAWPIAAVDDLDSLRAKLGLVQPGGRRWLIVDYRLPGGDTVVAGAQLEQVALGNGGDAKMRLFRTR